MDIFKDYINSVVQVCDSDYELVIPFLKDVKIKKRELLQKQGDTCRRVCFLKKGFLRMYYVDLEGNEINCRFVGENQFVLDCDSFITQMPSKYYWQAMQDSELLSIRYTDVQLLYSSCPTWQCVGRLMTEQLFKQVNDRVELLLFYPPEVRYQMLLNKSPELFNQVSQSHIASYLGVKPESLSRLRKRLMKKH
jgi:CRP-like cAMP-binding protein